jgi:hypothetical protein
MTTINIIRLAELAAEHHVSDRTLQADREGGAAWQPAGVRLDNDGCYRHWLDAGESRLWTLTHDGVGWRAVRPVDDGHVRRLADDSAPHGSFVGWLPAAGGGRIELEPARRYVIELASNEAVTGSAIYLGELID